MVHHMVWRILISPISALTDRYGGRSLVRRFLHTNEVHARRGPSGIVTAVSRKCRRKWIKRNEASASPLLTPLSPSDWGKTYTPVCSIPTSGQATVSAPPLASPLPILVSPSPLFLKNGLRRGRGIMGNWKGPVSMLPPLCIPTTVDILTNR